VLALDEALNKLAAIDLKQSEIVTLRFFGGLTENEIASILAGF
jgi:DNA-directed RNA polymerase specialized sigma24 family protein